MKKLIAITVLIVSICLNAVAQMDENIKPISFTAGLNLNENTVKVLPAFDADKAARLDMNDSKNGKLPMFSRNLPCMLSLANNGDFEKLAYTAGNKPVGTVYYRTVKSANALGLVVLFDKLYLPEGATLHVYSADRRQVLGAYTNANTPSPKPFNAGIIVGDSYVLEYFEPASQAGKGIIETSQTGHAYRWLKAIEDATGVQAAGSCEVNVACSEADNWQDQKRAVARILVVGTDGQGFCSGTLINNVRQDCTPYFLSAQHCSETTTANQYAQWVFYFNYEASTCAGTTGPQNKTVSGCTKIADSNDNGGDTGSDFLLLQLSQAPPSSYGVYYAGWNNDGNASTSGVCIHHPDGDIKKISTYSQTITSTQWGTSVQNTHWNVKWAATTNGHGVTEPGSSGSGLFNNQGMLIGTLTGGNSYCNTPNVPDQFGKLSYHWQSNGATDNRKLKPWLDPDNTGTVSIFGTNAPCGSNVQNDAGIQAITQPEGALCSLSVTPIVVLRNFGGNALQSVVISYDIDGTGGQYNWNGNLAAGGSTNVQLSALTVGAGTHTFTAQTSLPNGQTDNYPSNDAKSVTFTTTNPADALTLSLTTDSYGSETSWQILNSNNAEVTTGGPFTDVTGGQTFTSSICLPAGCYTFVLKDSYGDGMSDGGASAFTLTGNNGATEYASLSNRAFGYSESHQFCIQGTGITETTTAQVKIVPNPSTGLFTIGFADRQPRIITVTDMQGRIVEQTNYTGSSLQLNLSQQAKGIYLLQAITNGQRSTSKLVVE